MKTKQIEDKWENARSQAQAQFESIREMVGALRAAGAAAGAEVDERALEDAQRAIHEDALSVEVRSDWSTITDYPDGPVEYRILLCTGGPAVQITGALSEHGEPETARLEMQDWFLPWTEYRPWVDCSPWSEDAKARHDGFDRDVPELPEPKTVEAILLVYARQFLFGE